MLTTTNTILGLLLTLANNKYCLKKIQDELDVAIEKGTLPEFQDRAKTSYVEAVVLEAMRYATPVPLMPHWYCVSLCICPHLLVCLFVSLSLSLSLSLSRGKTP